MKRKIFLTLFSIIVFLFLVFFLGWYFYLIKEAGGQNFQKKIEKIANIIHSKGLTSEKFQFGSFPSLIESDFFKKVKEELIKEKLDFFIVDLSKKRLEFFERGEFKKSYSVLAIGKEGSFWETPVGFYQVEAKFRNAYSRLGNVYMPYSLQFQGNFFIHGWPYYPNGQEVSSNFSGGCIRLSNEDAKEIFEKVKVGTPILITEDSFLKDNFSYQLKLPEISAKAFWVADLKSNFVFLEKNSEEVLPIASITKLMSALVATEYINLWEKIEIRESDLIFTSRPRLKAGQRWSGFDLLYPLLTESSNETAKALARFLGESNFVDLMNKKAKAIGLEKTHFEDNFGGGDGNLSSAKDLFFLAKYLYNNRHFLLDISRGKIYHHLISKYLNDLKNFNCFSEKENFIGGKVGKTTKAGEVLLSIFEIEFGKEKRPIVIVVLGSVDSCGDGEKILTWLEKTFEAKF